MQYSEFRIQNLCILFSVFHNKDIRYATIKYEHV